MLITIYDKKTTKGNFNNNGLAVLHECIKCEVNEEQNGDYSLEMQYPSTSSKAQYLVKYNIIKVDGQLFRIYKVEKEHKNQKIINVWASHIFYDLAFDFIENVSLTSTSVKTAMISALQGGEFKTVYTLDSDIVIAGNISFSQINPAQAMFDIISSWGIGYLKRDNFDIKIIIASGSDTGVLVKYGKNIQGIKVTNDSTEVATKMYPVGNGGVTLTEKYITIANWNSDEYPSFSIIKKVEFDADDEPTLRIMANEKAETIGLERTTIEVDFVELSRTKEYENYKQLETVKVGDIVTLNHSELNLNVKVPVIRVTSDKLSGKNTKVQLGQPKKSYDSIAAVNAALKTVKDDLGNQIAAITSSMLYYANASAISVNTTSQQVIYLGITAVADTNLTLLLAIYGNASAAGTLTIQVILDNKSISFKPKQKLQSGDNVIGIPLGIPQVGAGAHYIGVIVSVDTGVFTIPQFNMQCMIDGRNLQGGLSAAPPHAEVTQTIAFKNVTEGKSFIQEITPNMQIPIISRTVQSIAKSDMQLGTVGLNAQTAVYSIFGENDSNINYIGTWTVQNNTSFYGGTAKGTTIINNSCKFNFTGTSLQIIGYKDSSKTNNVVVRIDGCDFAANFYSSSAGIYKDVVFGKYGLADKEHYCEVINLQDTKMLLIDAVCVDNGKILKLYNNGV